VHYRRSVDRQRDAAGAHGRREAVLLITQGRSPRWSTRRPESCGPLSCLSPRWARRITRTSRRPTHSAVPTLFRSCLLYGPAAASMTSVSTWHHAAPL
jgi:hypothetical protein